MSVYWQKGTPKGGRGAMGTGRSTIEGEQEIETKANSLGLLMVLGTLGNLIIMGPWGRVKAMMKWFAGKGAKELPPRL